MCLSWLMTSVCWVNCICVRCVRTRWRPATMTRWSDIYPMRWLLNWRRPSWKCLSVVSVSVALKLSFMLHVTWLADPRHGVLSRQGQQERCEVQRRLEEWYELDEGRWRTCWTARWSDEEFHWCCIRDVTFVQCLRLNDLFNPLTPTVAILVQIPCNHPVPDRVKSPFVIFDIRALWRSGMSVRVPGCQKLQMTA